MLDDLTDSSVAKTMATPALALPTLYIRFPASNV